VWLMVIWIFQQLQRALHVPTNSDEIELQAQAAVRRSLYLSKTSGWLTGAALTCFVMKPIRSLPEEAERGISSYHVEFEWRNSSKSFCQGSAEIKIFELGEAGYTVDFIILYTQTDSVHYTAAQLGDPWTHDMPLPSLKDKPMLELLTEDSASASVGAA
jgi:hypothetical protein